MEPQDHQPYTQPEQPPVEESHEPTPAHTDPTPVEPTEPTPPHNKLRHKKRLFIILLIIALLLVIGFILTATLWRPVTPVAIAPREIVNSTPDYDNSKYTVETTVTISGGTFTPSSILIKPNTRVNIQNTDSASHWLTLNDSTQKDGPATSIENDPDLPNRAEVVSDGGVSHVFEKPDTYVFHLTDAPESNLTITVQQ